MRLFRVPLDRLEHYDEVDSPAWAGELADSICTIGQTDPVAVAQSRTELDRGDESLFVFDGQHRLAAARALGLPDLLCVDSDADDAVPLPDPLPSWAVLAEQTEAPA